MKVNICFYGCWKHAGYISQNVGILFTDSLGIWRQTGRGEGRVFCRLLKSPERLWLESRKNLTTNMWVESLRYALFYCSLKYCYLVPHLIPFSKVVLVKPLHMKTNPLLKPPMFGSSVNMSCYRDHVFIWTTIYPWKWWSNFRTSWYLRLILLRFSSVILCVYVKICNFTVYDHQVVTDINYWLGSTIV